MTLQSFTPKNSIYFLFIFISTFIFSCWCLCTCFEKNKNFFHLRSSKNLGDSANTKSVIEGLVNGLSTKFQKSFSESIEVDVTPDVSGNVNITNFMNYLKNDDKMIVSSAGGYGGEVIKKSLETLEIFEKVTLGKLIFIYSSHQLYDQIKSVFLDTNFPILIRNTLICFPRYMNEILMNNEEISGIVKKYSSKIIYSLTVATSNTRDVIEEKGIEFKENNVNVDSALSSFSNGVLYFFIGGTSETVQGKWTNFTVYEAERQAINVVQEANTKGVSNIVVITHGVRTFANPKVDDPYVRELNRFEAYNAFIAKLSEVSKVSSIKCFVFGKDETTKNSIFFSIENGVEVLNMAVNGSPYFYGLYKSADVSTTFTLITEEQVTGVAELLESGCKKFFVVDFGTVSLDNHKAHALEVNNEIIKPNFQYISAVKTIVDSLLNKNCGIVCESVSYSWIPISIVSISIVICLFCFIIAFFGFVYWKRNKKGLSIQEYEEIHKL